MPGEGFRIPEALLTQAERRDLPAERVLFYPGDATDCLYMLESGAGVYENGQSVQPGTCLDDIAVLSALPHATKFTAQTDCVILCWPMADIWPIIQHAARQYLGRSYQQNKQRLDALAAPIHYQDDALVPGAFMFENTTLILAFCEINHIHLPDGLSLFRRPGRESVPLLLAVADFAHAYYEHTPEATFRYTETSYFIPVRHGRQWGLFPAHIYPSAWEPILLGREIYGFPKRLGLTEFAPKQARLSVDGQSHFELTWASAQAKDETRLVQALSAWLGIAGSVAAVAFQAGEVLRKASRLPRHRRVDVFNHKRILAADAQHDARTYAVNQLTRAAFGVLRWYHIAALDDPQLIVHHSPVGAITLREAYRTQLDMRLSTARVANDYGESNKGL